MAKKFKKQGFNYSTQRTIFYRHLNELPLNYDYSQSRYFGLFLAIDTPAPEEDVIFSYAYHVIQEGMAFFSVWGPDCQKMHTIFDEVIHAIEAKDIVSTNEETAILSVCHHHESIDEALDSYLNATPSEYYADECEAEYVLCIGSRNLDKKVKELMKKQIKFSKRKMKK